MYSLIEQIRMHIQDPGQTTTMSQYSPRRQALFPPTTLSVVEATETELDFKLPPLLLQLYTQVANGGFGPGYGILGLDGGYAESLPVPPDSVDQTKRGILTDWYFSFHDIGQPKLDFYICQMANLLFSLTLNLSRVPGIGLINYCQSRTMAVGNSLVSIALNRAFPSTTLTANNAN